MALQFISEADTEKLENKKVIARFDFNVPIKGSEILDTTRIDNALDSINYILEQKPKKLILMSHLGRPKGKTNKDFSLEPIANYLAEKINKDVVLTESCLDSGMKPLLELNEPQVIMLENLRFHKEETANENSFANSLASYGDVYVNDAFGTCHREHASTYGIIKYFKKDDVFAGLLIQKEIEALTKLINSPQEPFIAIMGGAKVSDKIGVIESLMRDLDFLLIGGAMAYPFLKAKGFNIGKSLCSEEDIKLAKSILNTPSKNKIILPIDHLVAQSPDEAASTTSDQNIADDMAGLDIGPQTIELFRSKLMSAKTILWNGPMGFFEKENFSKGTFEVAKIISKNPNAFSLVGGGDSVSAINKSGVSDSISHVSTGGGATLNYLEKSGALPGIQALKYGV